MEFEIFITLTIIGCFVVLSSGIKVLQTIEDRAVDFPYMTACDWVAIAAAKRHLENSLEVKEADLELITGWFDHIAQIADDRMTLTNQRMTDAHALDEIKCLAKNSSEFITKHYKAQKEKEV